MSGVVYDGQKEVRNKIICITTSYWKSLGPILTFHDVVGETVLGRRVLNQHLLPVVAGSAMWDSIGSC